MKLGNYYSKKALNYNTSKPRLSKILELAKSIDARTILDIGCATGYIGHKLKTKKNQVVGVDISKAAIKEAKKVLDKGFVVDIENEKLPFKNDYFDLIICSEVIEHIFNIESFLKEIKRVLKKGGSLIITTPNFLYWGHRIQFLKGRFDYQEEGPFDKGHIHFFTYETLRKSLTNISFSIEKENHVYPGATILENFKKYLPGIFAYQLILLCKSRTS